MVFRIIILVAGLAAMPCNAELRDPTQPAYPLPPATGPNAADNYNNLVLTAIWISSQSRRATINGISVKQGQTIIIEQTPAIKPTLATPVNAPPNGDKKNDLVNKAMEIANGNNPAQGNVISPLGNPIGNMIAPLLATAIGSMDMPQLQKHSEAPAETNTRRQTNAEQHAETVNIPARSSTVKVISIHKNSVVITQDGELKTLHLVQRPYKTPIDTNTH
ncbi:MAG: hypothetical protein ACXV9T_04795 [Methylobacter sp.]